MDVTLRELAKLVEGELTGDGDLVVQGAQPLCDAGPADITFLDRIENAKGLADCRAAAVVAPSNFADDVLPVICVEDTHRAFAQIVRHFRPPRQVRRIGISPAAMISPSALLGDDVDVYPGATIGDEVEIGAGSTIHSGAHIMTGAKIGQEVTIFPGAVIYENTTIGPRCIIHAGAALGAYGFGYDTVGGRHQLSAQLGDVVLGSDVEIGADTTVDRGSYGSTVIGEGTKIDNQVQIAHNCHIGRHNILCAQVGIAGSTSTGDYVVMAGQVGVRDHVRVGNGATLGAMAGVINDVPDGARMVGIPATPARDQKMMLVSLAKLPGMRKQMRRLQDTVAELAEKIAAAEDSAETLRKS